VDTQSLAKTFKVNIIVNEGAETHALTFCTTASSVRVFFGFVKWAATSQGVCRGAFVILSLFVIICFHIDLSIVPPRYEARSPSPQPKNGSKSKQNGNGNKKRKKGFGGYTPVSNIDPTEKRARSENQKTMGKEVGGKLFAKLASPKQGGSNNARLAPKSRSARMQIMAVKGEQSRSSDLPQTNHRQNIKTKHISQMWSPPGARKGGPVSMSSWAGNSNGVNLRGDYSAFGRGGNYGGLKQSHFPSSSSSSSSSSSAANWASSTSRTRGSRQLEGDPLTFLIHRIDYAYESDVDSPNNQNQP
jgi:hypothetical protein